MITLAAKICSTLGIQVSVMELLHNPTVDGMARFLKRQRSKPSPSSSSLSSSPGESSLASPNSSIFEADIIIPNVIPLQPARSGRPKAILFVFHFLTGGLDMLPQVVNSFDTDGSMELATYGIAWVPNRKLDTWDKMTRSYAQSIAAVAGSTPCFLLGWYYGGMIASSVARFLPGETTKVILLNSPAMAVESALPLEKSEYPRTFIYWISLMLTPLMTDLERLREVRNETTNTLDRKALAKRLEEADIEWHDSDRLISFARSHFDLPHWVTDADLLGCILPLADTYDVLLDLHTNYTPESFDTKEMEKKVVLNVQSVELHDGTERGLGWERYEVLGVDRWSYGYLPEVAERARQELRKEILGF